jgi:hypothetical protein
MHAGMNRRIAMLIAEDAAEKDQRAKYLVRDSEGVFWISDIEDNPLSEEAVEKVVPAGWLWHYGENHIRGDEKDVEDSLMEDLVGHLVDKNMVVVTGPNGKKYLPRIIVKLETAE